MMAFPTWISQLLWSRRALTLVLLAVLVTLRGFDPAPLRELRLRSFDLFQAIHPRADAARPVTIVDIDEVSLTAFGQWPWPRTLVADLVTRLFEAQAVAVAFDVIFAEADRTSPAEAVRFFREIDDATRSRLQTLPSNDGVLAQSFGLGRVVLGQSGTNVAAGSATDRALEAPIATLGPDPRPHLIGFPHLLRNIPQLEQASAGRGLLTIGTESDGMVRRVPLVLRIGERLAPALTVELLRVASGSEAILVRSDGAGVTSVGLPGLELPTDAAGRVWVYFGRHDRSRYVSARDVMEGRVGAGSLEGKLVLIGTSAIGLLDIKTTPVHPAMPGVEVHAQLLEAGLTGALLRAPAWLLGAEIGASVMGGLLLGLLAPAVGALALLVAAATLVAAFAAGSWLSFTGYRTLIDPTFPILSVVAIYIILTLIGYFREQIDRQRIRSAFAQYLAPSLVEQLARSPQQLRLGGETRHMTVLFSDVRGFTAIAETFADDPRKLTVLMNRLLTPLTNAIIARGGTIDKYMGDAVMAFWNAPLEHRAHEIDACRAALDMLESVRELDQLREREAADTGTPFLPIRIGIGINSGNCVVGNMGSDLRFQYTVMGDTVNVASRLEGQTAFYGLPIIIGGNTARAVNGHFVLLEVDVIRVKGKLQPETIHTILGPREKTQSEDVEKVRETWREVLEAYRSRQWGQVEKLLAAARPQFEACGAGALADVYAARSREFMQSPPAPDWDGVYTAATK